MPSYRFGRKDEPAAELVESSDMIAVRTRSRQPLPRGPVMTAGAAELERVRDFVARFLEVHLESRPSSYQRFLAAHNRNARTRTP